MTPLLHRTLAAAVAASLASTAVAADLPQDDAKQYSYQFGYRQGDGYESMLKQYQKYGIKLDADQMAQGFRDAVTGKKNPLDDEDAARLEERIEERFNAGQTAAAERNLAAGRAFLQENAKKEGVITTASGLQYRVRQAGSGPKINYGDTVSVSFTTRLSDGTEVETDYSDDNPQVSLFTKGEFVDGWEEALKLMQKGGEYTLYVPPELAFGDEDNETIPANSVLLYEVKVIDVEKAKPKAKGKGKKK